jgi:hypothetical protein
MMVVAGCVLFVSDGWICEFRMLMRMDIFASEAN